MTAPAVKNVLIIGASRGLGHALAAEYLARGGQVTATVRGAVRTQLHELADQSIPGVADTIEAQAARGGLQYLDYRGQTVAW